MKTKSILLAIIMLVSFAGVSAQSQKGSSKGEVLFSVPMDCHGCKTKIEKNIAFEKGVKDLDVNLEDKTVKITYDKRKTSQENLKAALGKLGYEAKAITPAGSATKKESDK